MLFEALDETPGTKKTITEGGLPALVGAETEIGQAREVRSRILVEADDVLTRLRSDEIITEAQSDTAIVSPRQVSSDQVHAAEVALNRLRGQTDAAWWVANSGRTAGELLETLMISGSGQP